MEPEANQYIDNDLGMYNITFYKFIKSCLIINKLNYRLYSIELTDGSIVRDPVFKNSKYVFNIPSSLLNKKIFFNARFLTDDIKNIKKFKFGLCDENVTWHDGHFLEIENNFNKTVLYKIETISDEMHLKDQANLGADDLSSELDFDILDDKTDDVSYEYSEISISQDLGKLKEEVTTSGNLKKSWKKSKK